MIYRLSSGQKFKQDHSKAIHITLLCQLSSHSVSVIVFGILGLDNLLKNLGWITLLKQNYFLRHLYKNKRVKQVTEMPTG